MKVIVDTNFPPLLAQWLASQGCDAAHTFDLGMAQATDRAIWQHAKAIGACIVTKDDVWLKAADPSGPAVIWVRIGNAIRRVLLQRMITAWPATVAQLENGAAVVEVR